MTFEAFVVFPIMLVALDASSDTLLPLAITTDIPLVRRLTLVAMITIGLTTQWRNGSRGSLG